jgi:hypothetical protein
VFGGQWLCRSAAKLVPHPQLREEEDTYEPPMSDDGQANGAASVGTGLDIFRADSLSTVSEGLQEHFEFVTQMVVCHCALNKRCVVMSRASKMPLTMLLLRVVMARMIPAETSDTNAEKMRRIA